jgi:hypothetical protein
VLTQASSLLAIDLDYGETVSRVASLLSSHAEWCVVETVDRDAVAAQVAVAHNDPRKRELVEEIRLRYPPSAEHPNLRWRVLTTGRPE